MSPPSPTISRPPKKQKFAIESPSLVGVASLLASTTGNNRNSLNAGTFTSAPHRMQGIFWPAAASEIVKGVPQLQFSKRGNSTFLFPREMQQDQPGIQREWAFYANVRLTSRYSQAMPSHGS
jgi:hypothetical protein